MSIEDYVRMAIYHKRKRQRQKAWSIAGDLSKYKGDIQYFKLSRVMSSILKEYPDKPKTLKLK